MSVILSSEALPLPDQECVTEDDVTEEKVSDDADDMDEGIECGYSEVRKMLIFAHTFTTICTDLLFYTI